MADPPARRSDDGDGVVDCVHVPWATFRVDDRIPLSSSYVDPRCASFCVDADALCRVFLPMLTTGLKHRGGFCERIHGCDGDYACGKSWLSTVASNERAPG